VLTLAEHPVFFAAVTAGPGLRWARGALLGAAVVGVSASAHAWAGGGWPPGVLALGAWLVLSAAFAAALGREAGAARIAGLQLAGQAGLHGLLALAHPGHGAAAALAPPVGGHLHSGSLAAGAPLAGSLSDSLLSGGWAMLLAHVGAAALLTAWLLAGERAVWSLLGGLAAAGSGVWSRTVALAARGVEGLPIALASPARVAARFGNLPVLRPGAVLRVAPRRGPPQPAAA
jgi:hypothetical protein